MSNRPIIALVDDETEITELAADALGASYDCRRYSKPDEFIAEMLKREFKPSVVVTDFKMPGMTGIEMLYELSTNEIMIPAILLSGFLSKETMSAAIGVGVIHTLEKPVDFDILVETVDKAMIDYELIKNRVELVNTIRLLKEVYTSFRASLPKILPPPMVSRVLSQPFIKKNGMDNWGYEKIMSVLEKRLNDLILDESILQKQKADKIKYDGKPKKEAS